MKITHQIEFGLIKENSNSLSALEMLYYNAKFNASVSKNEIKSIYDNLESSCKKSLYGESILALLEAKQTPNIGSKMIDFIAYDTEGKKHKLREFKRKYILFDFLGCILYALQKSNT